jgi:peptidoglycan/xylan/chitin deacetylase (PgdA/CDA1 family)
MSNHNGQTTQTPTPLSPRERAGVRAASIQSLHAQTRNPDQSSPHPNPLPGGEGTGTNNHAHNNFITLHIALALVLFTFALPACSPHPQITTGPPWTWEYGGVTRGDRSRKQLALIFTGGDKGEGSEHILDTLLAKNVKASFFVTGDYVAQPGYELWLSRMARDGHYLGPHSHGHLLYASWDDRNQSLVTEQQFKDDLQQNIDELQAYGAMRNAPPIHFIPPYEYYNAQHAQWAADIGCRLFNFTHGSGSHRDWIPENHQSFRTSTQILQDILHCEANDPHGLNGHLLLLHLGGERKDKMYWLLADLIDELHDRGYQFVRVDELLDTN